MAYKKYQNYKNKGNNYGSSRGRNEEVSVFAPYNFVPFPSNPAYVKEEDIIGHDVMAQVTNDGEDLFSGEIHYTLEAKTPIFVDDGSDAHRFCRDAAGNCIIPGSTMRGLIRNNAMVLGLGNVRDEVDDYSLMYRNVANGLNKNRYGDILGAKVVTMQGSNGKTFSLSVLKNVQAGYIEKRSDGKYVIYKTVIDPEDEKDSAIDKNLGKMNYYTISERFIIERYLKDEAKYKANPDSFPFSFLIPNMQNMMMNQTKPFHEEYDRNGNKSYKGVNNFSYIPYHRKISYKLSGNRNVSELKSVPIGSEAKSGNSDVMNGKGCLVGELVSTGFMQKKKVIYVVPAIDPGRVAVVLEERDVRDFLVDYNRRKNSITLERKNPHRNNLKKIEEYKAFFNLPEEIGERGRKPVFYIQLGGKCYFGFTPRLRLFYDNTVADGINRNHISGKTDYVKAIFGYTASSGVNGSDNIDSFARKSRVSFSDAVLVGKEKVLPTRYLTLSEPRPTDCLNYLDQSVGETSYNTNKMRLRGAKQYWLHAEANPGIEEGKQNKNLDSELNPIDSGSCFRGVIRFKNLRRYELGLLLWSIRLEKNSWMNLGKGKPYGYGAVKVTVELAQALDYEAAYGLSGLSNSDDKKSISATLFGNPYKPLNVDELIEDYRVHIRSKNAGKDIMKLPLIVDFFAMKDSTKIPNAEATGYMTLEQFQSQTRYKAPLPTPMDVIKKNT